MSALATAIVEDALARIRPPEIARKRMCGVETVYHHISQARKKGVDIPHFHKGRAAKFSDTRSGDVQAFPVPHRLLGCLRDQAEARKLTPQELAAKILEKVVLEGLIDAVLDDGGALQ